VIFFNSVRFWIAKYVAVESPKVHMLSAQQNERLDLVINKLLSYEKNGLGRTHLMEHVIDVADAKPVMQRHWPISPAKENMLALGVIEESKSPWSSNCVLGRKGQKVRLCLDSREVNKLTIKDAYPLPHIDGILSRLPPARYITGLDMKHAFWQIPLEKSPDSIRHLQYRTGPYINIK